MDVFRSPCSGQGPQPEGVPPADPRLRPTPDYGTLGPGSDVAGQSTPGSSRPPVNPKSYGPLLAGAIGIFLAMFVGNIGKAHAAWSSFSDLFSARESAPASAHDSRQLDRMRPQKQAETLLELAVGHSDGAVEQISARVDRWHGRVQWNSQIATL